MKLAPPRPVRPEEEEGVPTAKAAPAVVEAGRSAVATRKRARRTAGLLKGIAVLLAAVGVLVLTDAVATLVWQEPISGLLAHFQQARLAENLKHLEGARATPADEQAIAGLPSDSQRMAFFARKLQLTARAGQAVGRVRIPRIGANFVVVAGTAEGSLQKGPGIYSGTSVPGLPGTVGIAGHRTTYLAPFRRINELARGDRITLEMPYGLFSYTVMRHAIVSPNDVSVLARAPYDQVVLTACHPLYSAAQRIVVFARLSAAAPAGPALPRITAVVPPAPPSAAQVANAILGDALSPEVAPSTDGLGAVVIGGGVVAPGSALPKETPATPASKQPSRPKLPATRRPPPASAPLRAVRPPVPTGPARPIPVRPVPVAPRPTTPAIQHNPTPPPPRRPAVKSPPKATLPAAPPAPTQPQTRVQGRPGGPAPIIGVTSG